MGIEEIPNPNINENEWQQNEDKWARSECTNAGVEAELANPKYVLEGMHWNHFYINIRNFMGTKLQELDTIKQGTALDIGCGGAPWSFMLENEFPFMETIAMDAGTIKCDYVNKLIKKLNAKNMTVLCSTLENCTLPEKSFDIIHCSQTIEHVRDPRYFLQKITKLLKPDGVFVGSCPVEGYHHGPGHLHFFEQPDMIIADMPSAKIGTCRGPHWNLRNTLSEFFSEVKIEYYTFSYVGNEKDFAWGCSGIK